MIVVDAMNVRGSIPDGWWKDKDAALIRLVDAIAGCDWNEWVVVVADGRPVRGLSPGTRGEVELRYAGHSAPDAADDEIVAIVEDAIDDDELLTVVTSDRGLIDRLPSAVRVEGARTFRRRVGA
ncbi:MAG: hypothetical protein AAF548_10055 [Actinomycetota bacterium]